MVSPNSTLPGDEKEAQDSAYNPGDTAYQNGMGSGYASAGLDQLEAHANDPSNHNSNESLGSAEEAGNDSLSGGLYKPSEKVQVK